MSRIYRIPAATILVAILVGACQRVETPKETGFADSPRSYERIVSLAPSVTETLFALGLGDRVVGVTRYCEFPPETDAKEEVGGFLDPNYEAILRLKPDLAIVLDIHGDAAERLQALDVDTLAVNHRTLDGILASIEAIGAKCDVDKRADVLVTELRDKMERVVEATAGRPKPRVLLSAGRQLGSGTLREVYAAGNGQWYDDLIELAGGRNAFQKKGVMFPALSGEGLLRLNPDVIIEMAPDLHEKGLTEEDVVGDWEGLEAIHAVRENRIHVLSGDYVTIPGPRFIRILEDIARVLHPDAFKAGP